MSDVANNPQPASRERDRHEAVLETQRFSLWGLLGIVTAASVVMAIGNYLPKPVFAGAVGMATLVTMIGLSAMKEPPAVLQVAWWTLLLIYLMAIASAVLA